MPDFQGKITKETCEGKTLYWLPESAEETSRIIGILTAWGFKWASSSRPAPQEIETFGICLENGKIYSEQDQARIMRGIRCDAGQLDDSALKAAEERVAKGLIDEELLADALARMDALVGMEKPKAVVKRIVNHRRAELARKELGLPVEPSHYHMLLVGPQGTGKTIFVHKVLVDVLFALALIKKREVHEINRGNNVGDVIGATEKIMAEHLEQAKGGLAFWDEAYANIQKTSDGDERDFGNIVINLAIPAMENDPSTIHAFAGYPGPMKKLYEANQGFKSRVRIIVPFEIFTRKELGKIMGLMLEERGLQMTSGARKHALDLLDEKMAADGGLFGNGRAVRNLVETAAEHLEDRLGDQGKLAPGHGGLSAGDFRRALSVITLFDVRKLCLDDLEILDRMEEEGIGMAKASRGGEIGLVKYAPSRQAEEQAKMAVAMNRRSSGRGKRQPSPILH